MTLCLRGGRVLDPGRGVDRVADLLIDDRGRVAEIGEGLETGDDCREMDVSGLVVTPGLIDIHVHLREPGQEYKETVATGARAAVAGGFTTVVCMANTAPANDRRSVTEHILAAAARADLARVLPVSAISRGLEGKRLAEIGECVGAGAVGISDDGRPVESPELMRRALEHAQAYDVPVIQHAQDLALSGDGVMHEGAVSARLGVPGIPGAAEDVMVARDLVLAEVTGGRYHVQHLSTSRSLDLVRMARERGVRATCEVTPHHLLLTDETVAEQKLSPDTKMNPPLRSEEDRAALVAGLLDGAIDCIASDHAPHHPDEKELDFVAAPFGIVGLETTLSLCLDRLVRLGDLPLERLVELLTSGPARVMGLEGGSLRPGGPADVTVLDLDLEVTVDPARFHSKGRNTPFGGWKLTGGAVATLVAGRLRWHAPSRGERWRSLIDGPA